MLLLVAIVFFALVLVRHVAVLAGARDVPSEYEVVLPLEEGGRRLGGESAAPRPPSTPAPSASPPPPTAKAWARQCGRSMDVGAQWNRSRPLATEASVKMAPRLITVLALALRTSPLQPIAP